MPTRARYATQSRPTSASAREETELLEEFTSLEGLAHARRNLRRWMRPEPRRVAWWSLTGRAHVLRQPVGVVGIIVPWNYPLYLAMSPLTAAIAAGNRAMIKLSEHAPRFGALFASLLSRRFAPLAVTGVTAGMRLLREEIFGPVLPVIGYDAIAEAIAFVNARPRPLALYYFGPADATRDAVLTQTVSGGVTVNNTGLHVVQEDLPFGGVGASGMGQYHGRAGFETFAKEKPVYFDRWLSSSQLLMPPYGRRFRTVLRLLNR